MKTLHKIIKQAAEFEKMTEAPILNYLTIYEDKNGVTKSAFTYTNEQQLFKRLGIKDTQNIYDFLLNKYGMKGLTLYYLLADIELPF